MTIKGKRCQAFIVLIAIGSLVTGCYVSSSINPHSDFLFIVAVLWIILLNKFMLTSLRKMGISRRNLCIVLVCFYIRFFLTTIVNFGHGLIVRYIQDFGDQLGFIEALFSYYDNSPTWFSSHYPKWIAVMYRFTGSYEIMGRYVNVFVWFLDILLLSDYLKEANKQKGCEYCITYL